MDRQQDHSRNRKFPRRLAIVIATIIVLAAGAIAAVNVFVLPAVAESLERTLKNDDFAVRIGGLRYWPFYGIVLRNVALGRDLQAAGESTAATSAPDVHSSGAARAIPTIGISSVGFRASRIRVRSPESVAIRWIRASRTNDLSIPDAKTGASFFTAAEPIATAGLIPKRITIGGFELGIQVQQDVPMTLHAKRIDMIHDSGGSTIHISARESSAGTLNGSMRVNYRSRAASGSIKTGPLALTVAPFSAGTASAELSFQFEQDSPVDVSGTMTMRDLSMEVPAVAEQPISDLEIQYDFEAVYSQEAASHTFTGQVPLANKVPAIIHTNDKLTTSTGNLRFNDIVLEMKPVIYGLLGGSSESGASEHGGSERRPAVVRVVVHLPATEVQSIIDSIPQAVSGKLANTKTAGAIAWDMDLLVPMAEISRMQWTSDVELDQFAVLEIDPTANVYSLNGEFIHAIRDGSHFRRIVRIPPARQASMAWMLEHSEHTQAQIERIRKEDRAVAASRPAVRSSARTGVSSSQLPAAEDIDQNYRYVYVDDMSPWIVRAVLTAEDGDFFFYDGINPVTFADAIEINVEAGEILFGASTISMQLIKILFLDQKRIFARKIQEAFLVYLMEHHVPVSKERILELYLNLAEFGPGIFGVSDASEHYFDKSPSQLSAGEATWLASILPSPKTYYGQFEDRAITAGGFQRMVALYDIMVERGRMTEEEYNQAIDRPPEFASRR